MQVTRNAVFETNSSSSHSLTLDTQELVPLPFPKNVLRDGVITVPLGEFGWEWRVLCTTEGKLSYLLTQLLGSQYGTADNDDEVAWTEYLREQSPSVDTLCRVVESYTGCKLYVKPSSGYVDHDSVGVGTSVLSNDDDIKHFLFNPKSYIRLGNDNDSPPPRIPTDSGGYIEPYAASYATVPDTYVPVVLRFRRYGPTQVTTATGSILDPDSPLMLAVAQSGVVTRLAWVTEDPKYYSRNAQGQAMDMLADGYFLDGDTPIKFTATLETGVVPLPRLKYPERQDSFVDLTIMVPPPMAEEVLGLPPPSSTAVAVEDAQ